MRARAARPAPRAAGPEAPRARPERAAAPDRRRRTAGARRPAGARALRRRRDPGELREPAVVHAARQRGEERQPAARQLRRRAGKDDLRRSAGQGNGAPAFGLKPPARRPSPDRRSWPPRPRQKRIRAPGWAPHRAPAGALVPARAPARRPAPAARRAGPVDRGHGAERHGDDERLRPRAPGLARRSGGSRAAGSLRASARSGAASPSPSTTGLIRAGRRGSRPCFGGWGCRRPSSWSASSVVRHPDLVASLKDEGFELGAHTFNHVGPDNDAGLGAAPADVHDRYRDRRSGRGSPALLPPSLLGRPGVDHPHAGGGVGLDRRPGPPDRALQLRLGGLARARCHPGSSATRPRPGAGAA